MLAASGLLALVVMAAFAVMLLALREERAAAELAESAQRVEASAYELERRVVDLESSHRGFVLTSQESFLDPWRDAEAALRPLELELMARISDERQIARARGLFEGIERYIDEWSRPGIDLGRRDAYAARQQVATGEGKRRMDELRARFAAFHTAEHDLATARGARAERFGDFAIATGVVGLVGSGLIVFLFALYLSRSIVGPTSRLAVAAARISDGDLTARVPEEGAGELERLARGFNRMAERVQHSRTDLERQQRELRELDRLKDEFVATVSHELRTPLTSMVGFLEILREQATGPLTDDQRNFLEIVARNADRLTRLVGDLLFVARLDADQLHLDVGDVDVAALLAEAVESARATALHRGVRLELEAAHGLAHLRGDGERLRQLIDNLISNALKFTPEGGRVAVRARSAGGAVRIDVSDTGIGIPVDEVGRIAERFFRASSATERQIPGTGLGLAISKAIVDAHGGSVEVESQVGVGTTFRVDLPLAAAAVLAA
jgi:signal transduction histidine kinase